ncbi:hypothetical protein [Pantoea sp. SOD02]|uniref:hypothetical protein n=1 Tax=Pantoea sp. SOD02 TaxID=2970818 RepID=UPI0021573891|nr:hypothetical protein [Pantoea sp. SOD02]UVC32089.1 hypothetical protein NR302_21220 [Pantoea sp. SOD02]
MRKLLIVIATITSLIAPWLVVKRMDQTANLTLNCVVPFTINSQKTNSMLMNGMIKSHYYSNGSGIGILSGNMHYRSKDSNATTSYSLHRNIRFTYQQSHSYVTTHTQEMHPAFGESIPENLADEYIFPSFKKGFNDYYQIHKMANGDMMVSVANMPRLYCHVN